MDGDVGIRADGLDQTGGDERGLLVTTKRDIS
jgi:hypothetical protein